MKRLAFLAFLLAAPSQAQQAQPFVPLVLDERRWNEFVAALDQVSMPNSAYRQIGAILQNMEKQAQAEAAAKATPPATPSAPEAK